MDLATRARSARAPSIIAALSELAATVQRRRNVDDVLETAGQGVQRLGMRFGVFQLSGEDLVLRNLATSPIRVRTIERSIGRPLRGLAAPLADWDLVRSVVLERRIVFREDIDVFDRFLRAATGFDPAPLDEQPETASITCGVLAPLFVRDQPWGLLIVYSPYLTHADADAVALFATHVGSALEVAESLEALSRAQEELLKRERLAALGELAAIVAHEVRNPLGVLFNSIGSLRTIVDAGAPADRLGDAGMLLEIAAQESERLKQIVSDLLQFARPYVPELTACSLDELITDIATATGNDPRLVLDVATNLPRLEMDPRHVRQALINLVQNGLQAISDVGHVVICATRVIHAGRFHVRLDVTDTGTGIPAHVRDTMFEPFVTTKASGTGLGLAIVKRIVDAHGWTLEVESGPDGTTFSILIPQPRA